MTAFCSRSRYRPSIRLLPRSCKSTHILFALSPYRFGRSPVNTEPIARPSIPNPPLARHYRTDRSPVNTEPNRLSRTQCHDLPTPTPTDPTALSALSAPHPMFPSRSVLSTRTSRAMPYAYPSRTEPNRSSARLAYPYRTRPLFPLLPFSFAYSPAASVSASSALLSLTRPACLLDPRPFPSSRPSPFPSRS